MTITFECSYYQRKRMLMDAYRECITLGDDNFIENLVIIILNIRDSNIPYLYKYI